MKVALVTTLTALSENERIAQEGEALGHEFEILDLSEFSFSTVGGVLNLPKITNLSADVVIIRGIFNAIKPISVAINDLKKKGVRVFDNSLLEHKYSIDKVTDIIKLSLAGIPVPNTFYVRDFKEMGRHARETGFPVVVKPVRTGKGAGVFKADSEGELAAFIGNLVGQGKEAKSYLIQEYIDYELDLRSLVIGERVYTMRRIPKKDEFRANFSLGASVEPFSLSGEDRELAKKVLSAVDMSIGGVDILVGRDGRRYVLEVNHTAGFTGMEKATGENIARAYVKHAIKNAK